MPDYHDLARYDTPGVVFRRSGFDRRAADVAAVISPPDSPDDGSPLARWWRVYSGLRDRLGTGMLIGLVGKFGCGKTVMATRLMLDACDKHQATSVCYRTASRFFRELHDSRNSNMTTEQATINRYVRHDLLVLDESHERANTDYEDRRLIEVVNMRYGRGRDTILISNLSAAEFASSIGGAVVDRMNQVGGMIECGWGSFRRKDAVAGSARQEES